MHHSCSLKQLFWNHARWDWSIPEKVWVCCLDCALSLPLRAIVIRRCWIEIGVHWLTEAGSWRLAINAWLTQVELRVAALFQSNIIQLHQKSVPLISEQTYHRSTLYKRESFKWIILNLKKKFVLECKLECNPYIKLKVYRYVILCVWEFLFPQHALLRKHHFIFQAGCTHHQSGTLLSYSNIYHLIFFVNIYIFWEGGSGSTPLSPLKIVL